MLNNWNKSYVSINAPYQYMHIHLICSCNTAVPSTGKTYTMLPYPSTCMYVMDRASTYTDSIFFGPAK